MASENARRWLNGKTLEDLDVIEFGGRLLFPDKILKVRRGGKFDEIEVAVRIPREPEIATARVEAVRLFKARGLDRKDDADLFEQLDVFCKLALAIRTRKPPHPQFLPVEELIGRTNPETGETTGFDATSLFDLWQRIETYRTMCDPRITEPTVEDVLIAADGIARTRTISPLVAIAGPELDSFIVSMGSLLSNYRTELLRLQSIAISMPEP